MKSLLSFKSEQNIKRARHCLALLLVLTALLPVRLNAQKEFNYFEKRYDFHNNYDRAQNILPVDSSYIIAGITEDSLYPYNYHFSITKISSETGELLLNKEYGSDTINILTGNPKSLIKYNDEKYLLSGAKWVYTENGRQQPGVIYCFDNLLDTLWTKEFAERTEPYDTAYGFFQIYKESNYNFILTGVQMPYGLPMRIWLLKTDSLGNKLWERFYGEGEQYFQGHSVVQTNDGGYVIGGGKFTIGWSGTLDPLLIKTDSLGNEEWRINPGNPNVDDNKVMVALASDGNIIVGTNYGTEQHVDNRDAVVKIMKITPEGTVLWDHNYLEPQWDNFLLNITVLNNGNIISNGSYTTYYIGTDYPESMGWILCTDSTGTQLWYKEYALLTAHNSFNDLYDVRETPDGGLIGCGMVNPGLPDTGTNDIWLMKMDSTGCLYAGCDTTVVVEEIASPADEVGIYPNPVTGAFSVDIGKPLPETGQVVLYNLYGVKVREVEIPKAVRVVNINASGWQPGLYVAVVSSLGKTVGKKKFVVR